MKIIVLFVLLLVIPTLSAEEREDSSLYSDAFFRESHHIRLKDKEKVNEENTHNLLYTFYNGGLEASSNKNLIEALRNRPKEIRSIIENTLSSDFEKIKNRLDHFKITKILSELRTLASFVSSEYELDVTKRVLFVYPSDSLDQLFMFRGIRGELGVIAKAGDRETMKKFMVSRGIANDSDTANYLYGLFEEKVKRVPSPSTPKSKISKSNSNFSKNRKNIDLFEQKNYLNNETVDSVTENTNSFFVWMLIGVLIVLLFLITVSNFSNKSRK